MNSMQQDFSQSACVHLHASAVENILKVWLLVYALNITSEVGEQNW